MWSWEIPACPTQWFRFRDCAAGPEAELFALGRKLRAHPAFPKGANVNFFDVEGPGRIWERTFERGVEGFTYACGTGTGSVAAVLTLQGAVSGRRWPSR